MNNETLKKQLDEFLQIHYTALSPEWRATTSTPPGMTEEEVEALLEAMKESKSMELTTKESLTHKVLTSGCRSAGSFERILGIKVSQDGMVMSLLIQ